MEKAPPPPPPPTPILQKERHQIERGCINARHTFPMPFQIDHSDFNKSV